MKKYAVSFCVSWVVCFFFFDSFQFCCLCIIVEQKSVSFPVIHSYHTKSQALLLNICVSVFISSKKKKKNNRQTPELPLKMNLTVLPTLEAPDNAVLLK